VRGRNGRALRAFKRYLGLAVTGDSRGDARELLLMFARWMPRREREELRRCGVPRRGWANRSNRSWLPCVLELVAERYRASPALLGS